LKMMGERSSGCSHRDAGQPTSVVTVRLIFDSVIRKKVTAILGEDRKLGQGYFFT